MHRVMHDFLFKGKRYKEGQLIPDDHTAVMYRTQFVEPVSDDVEADNASTEAFQASAEDMQESKKEPDSVETVLVSAPETADGKVGTDQVKDTPAVKTPVSQTKP